MTKPIIDIIATGSGCDPELLSKPCAFIESLGFTPRYSEPFFEDHPLYICSDEQRFLNLKRALYAGDSDFIWCLRGGSGTSRLLPKLLELEPPQKEKTLLGFSDVTALHFFLTQQWGWKSLHGPTLNAFAITGQTERVDTHIRELLRTGLSTIDLPLTLLNNHAVDNLDAPIVGGNLALTQLSIGTRWQINTQGKIVFFEDINEAPYRVAEILFQLTQAGVFKEAKAVLLGDFSQESPEKGDDKRLSHVLKNFADSLDIPVFKDLAVGHIKDNHPIHLNASMMLLSKDGQYHYRQKIYL